MADDRGAPADALSTWSAGEGLVTPVQVGLPRLDASATTGGGDPVNRPEKAAMPLVPVPADPPSSGVSFGIAAATMSLGLLIVSGAALPRRRRDTRAQPPVRRIIVDPADFVPAAAPPLVDSLPRRQATGTASPWPTMKPISTAPVRPAATTAAYRLFRLNETGMVDLAETACFTDDDAAMKRASLFGEGRPVEVWRGRRRIAVVSDTRAISRAPAPYAFHEIEPGGRAVSPRLRDFGSDNAAMAHALKLSKGRNVEVWSQDRHVATLCSGAMA